MSHDETKLLLSDYLLGDLDEVRRAQVDKHLIGCNECREVLEVARALGRELGQAPDFAHPGAEEMVAYADPDGDLSTSRLAEIAMHTASCASCREELQLAREALSPPRRRSARAVAYVATAAIILLLIYSGWRSKTGLREMAVPTAVAEMDFPENFDPDRTVPVEGSLQGEAATSIRMMIPATAIPSGVDSVEDTILCRISSLPDEVLRWTRKITPTDALADEGATIQIDLPAGSLGAGTYKLDLLEAGIPIYRAKFRLRLVHGGEAPDNPGAVIQMPDGGYLVAAGTYSFGDRVNGACDGWLLRLDKYGQKLWDRAIGGTGWESLNCMRQTPDGGFICTGFAGSAFADLWLLKLDAEGNVEFDRRFGKESGWDNGRDVICTRDGGYAAIGYTRSYGPGPYGIIVVKVDRKGGQEWVQLYGGEGSDRGKSIVQLEDGTYLVSGDVASLDQREGKRHSDAWLARIDEEGNLIWSRRYGTPGQEGGGQILPSPSGGHYILGWSRRAFRPNGEKLDKNDPWLIKVDADGNLEWERIYGEIAWESFARGLVNDDGNLVILGSMAPTEAEEFDLWLLCLDPQGVVLWERRFGGPGEERGHWLTETRDGGYMLSGSTTSWGSGDRDIWLVKTDGNGNYQPGAGTTRQRESWDRVFAHGMPAGLR